MIKTFTAHTSQTENPDKAVAEILKQLADAGKLLKNSVGIINCHPDFVKAGILQKLCKKLSFETVGLTTLETAVNGGIDKIMLTITVITSDELSFSLSVTSPLTPENYKNSLVSSYKEASHVFLKKPSLIMIFAPFLFEISGDNIVETLDSVSGGIPIFGALAVDHTIDHSESMTFYGGKATEYGLVLLLIEGNIKPVFSTASVSKENFVGKKALITQADGNILKTIDNMPALTYLQSLGLTPAGRFEEFKALHLIIDYGDGLNAVARSLLAIMPEGYAVCGGAVVEKMSVNIGRSDKKDVIITAREAISNLKKDKANRHGLFVFSCIVRNFVLGKDSLSEIEEVNKNVSEIPFFMAYSGGEFCPVYDKEGKIVNRFHNGSIVSCLF